MRKIFTLIAVFSIFFSIQAVAQVQSSGTCGGGCNWSDGASWSPPTPGGPTSANGAITILAGDVINLDVNATIDETTVAAGGTLNINNGQNLSVTAGPGTDLTIAGTVVNNGTLTMVFVPPPPFPQAGTVVVSDGGILENTGSISGASTSALSFAANGTYIHNQDGGAIPTASWNNDSNCNITGMVATGPTGVGQNFGNFTWNCSGQTGFADFAGGFGPIIDGNLSFLDTGSGQTYFTSSTDYSLTVNGNYSVTNSWIGINSIASTVDLTVNGDFTTSNSTVDYAFGGITTLDINGNYSIGGGTHNYVTFGLGNTVIIEVEGDFTISSNPTIGNDGTGSTTITFNGPALNQPQTYTSSQAFTGFTHTILNQVQLDIPDGSFIGGNGDFNLNAGATLGVGDANGLVDGTGSGNIRITAPGTRTYAASSNIVYNGSGNQNLGTEWGTGDLSGVSVNLEIDKASGQVNNNNNGTTSVLGNLTLTEGALSIGTSNTLDIGGVFTATNGTIVGSTTSSLAFSGSGAINGDLTFTSSLDLANLTIDRAVDVTLGSDLTISTLLSFPSSGNLDISGRTLNVVGDITQPMGSGGLISDNVSTLAIGGSGALTTIPFSGSGNQLNNLFLNRTGGATYSWSSTVEVINTIFLTTGTLDHTSGLTPGSGSTIRVSGGASLINNALAGSNQYNVSYSGNVSTGLELPASTSRLLDLTVDGTVTLNQNATVNDVFTIESGQLDFNGNVITMSGPNWDDNGGSLSNSQVIFDSNTLIGGSDSHQFVNIFITSTGNLDLGSNIIEFTGNITNNGTMVGNASTVVFTGTTNIEKTASNGNVIRASFNNVIISSSGTLGVETQVGSCAVDCGDGIDTFYAIEVEGDFLVQSGGTFDPNVDDPADPGCEVLFAGSTHNITMAGESFANLGIEPNASVTLDEALVAVGSIVISANGTLSTGQFNQDIAVGKDFRILGTFTPNQGSVTFNGDANQLITDEGAGSNIQFWNIDINKSSGDFTFDCDIELLNQLDVTSFDAGADLFFSGAFGNLVLRSTASRTARINTLPSSITPGNTSGNVTVEKYTTNSSLDRVYRYLSSPVTDAFVSDWKNEFPITGTFNDPSTQAEWPGIPGILENSPSMFRYDPSIGTTIDDRYESYPLDGTSSTASSLENGRGYAAFVRQTSPIVIDVTGTPAIGDIDVDVFSANEGYNLVGNPYPAPINWDNVSLPAGVSTQISMRDNTGNLRNPGDYVYYSQGGASIPASYNGDLAIAQAFWVETSSDATITFSEDDKVTSPNPVLLDEFVPEDLFRLTVTGVDDTDELIVRFESDATDDYDGQYDAIKRPNLGINMSTKSADQTFAINTLPGFDCSRTVDVQLDDIDPGEYSLSFNGLETFTGGSVYIIDNLEGNTMLAKTGELYAFSVSAEANTFGSERFDLLFVDSEFIDNSLAVESTDACDGNTATVSFTSPNGDVQYYLTKNGLPISDDFSGVGEINIPVASEDLEVGENTILVWGRIDGCANIPLEDQAIIAVGDTPDAPTLTSTDFVLCDDAELTVTATGAETGQLYRLYDSNSDLLDENESGEFLLTGITETDDYSISIVSADGCESSMEEFLVEYGKLNIPEIEASKTTVCGSESVVLSVNDPIDGLTYQWLDASDNLLAEGVQYTTEVLSSLTSFKLLSTNSDTNCSSENATITIEYSDFESPNITAASSSICDGESIALAVDNIVEGVTYDWLDADGNVVKEDSPEYTSDALDASTAFKVVASKPDGCSLESVFEVTVNDIPVITSDDYDQDDGRIMVNISADKYIWRVNGEIDESVTGSVYEYDGSVNDLELAIEQNGCTSDFISFQITGISPSISDYFKVYPNPTNGRLILEKNINRAVSIRVIKEDGKEIMNRSMEEGTPSILIDLENYDNGFYLVYVEIDDNFNGYIRIVKK